MRYERRDQQNADPTTQMANAIDQQQVICGGEPIVILEGDTEINGKPRKVKPTFAMANSI